MFYLVMLLVWWLLWLGRKFKNGIFMNSPKIYRSKNCVKKNEITFLPYVNQDYNAKHNRIDWVDPRAQRGGAVLGTIFAFVRHPMATLTNAILRSCTSIFHGRGLENRPEAFTWRNSRIMIYFVSHEMNKIINETSIANSAHFDLIL